MHMSILGLIAAAAFAVNDLIRFRAFKEFSLDHSAPESSTSVIA